MIDHERLRQLSMLALIAQAHPSELDHIKKQIESGELGLTDECKKEALKIIETKKKELVEAKKE
ncbi:MAG: hypothetical protein COU51_04745 [Parcubacteria group bacterium CG10_big_fil_rev_8_21_14_0_10_36_14]|nr:MAG: hypothetical protein COU51_04745 [Parcubacteria group bacterium CG10_big_fil_rev_8_21_14_0_10_36_14]